MSDETTTSAAARLFDIRVLIGGLFVIYGLMLTIAGFFTSSSELHKAVNININLWLGIGMLVVGLLFLSWWKLRPLRPADEVDRHDPRTSGDPADRNGAADRNTARSDEGTRQPPEARGEHR